MSSEALLPPRGEVRRHATYCSFDFGSRQECVHPHLSLELRKELIVAERGAWKRFWIVQWSQHKVIDPFVMILRRGLEPKLLSLSVALGLTLGVFPVCGVPLVFCTMVALVLRSKCHVPTLMLGNFVASFFELGLVVPYMRIGESVMGGEHFLLSSSGIWEALRGRESHALILGVLHAIIGWAIFAPITVAVLYISSLPIFKYLTARLEITKLPLGQCHSDSYADIRPDDASTSDCDALLDV